MNDKLIYLAIVALVALSQTVYLALKIIAKRSKKNDSENNPKGLPPLPGQGQVCIDHDRDIVELKTCMKIVKEALPRLEEKMEENFNRIYDLLRNKDKGRR